MLTKFKKTGVGLLSLAGVIFLSLVFMYFWRFQFSSSFAYSWDAVDFALALERFDLLAMQPHFPGYPYFILGGMLVNRWIEDPALSLSFLNVWMSLLSTIPIYCLGRRKLTPIKSMILALFIQSSVYITVLSTQPISEGMAIAVLWWYLWSLQKGMENGSWSMMVLPLLLFGILMGVRLSYIIFGLGIVLLWYYDWKRHRNWGRLFSFVIMAFIFQLFWVVGLIISEGDVIGFVQLAQGFVGGHFNDWGGAVSTTSEPIFIRFAYLLFHNLIWVCLFGQSIIVACLLTLFLALVIVYRFQKGHLDRGLFSRWLILLGIIYFIYVLFAQNIDKPRHIAPLIGIISFLLFTNIYNGRFRSKWFEGFKHVLVATIILAQMYIGAELIKQLSEELPSTYQLAYSLEELDEDLVVYTWEETRVMEYLDVSYEHERIYSYDYFLQDMKNRPQEKIFLTDHVYKGFQDQGHDLSHKVEEVGIYRSQSIIDPVYHQIILLEWVDR